MMMMMMMMMVIEIYEVEDHEHDGRYLIPTNQNYLANGTEICLTDMLAALNLIFCYRTRSKKLYLLGVYQIEMECFRCNRVFVPRLSMFVGSHVHQICGNLFSFISHSLLFCLWHFSAFLAC